MSKGRERYARNCEGPFYVANGECIACGVPELEADGLMSHDDDGHCFFVRQPVSAEETNAAVRSIWAACCGAVRYGGNDPQILTRLVQLDAALQCDQAVTGDHAQAVRNCARFEYGTTKSVSDRRNAIEKIATIIADTVREFPNSEFSAFRYSPNEASFLFGWSNELNASSDPLQFSIRHELADRWFLRISGREAVADRFHALEPGDSGRLRAIAIGVDKALQRNAAFRFIRWFEESSGPDDRKQGEPHPY